MIKHSCIIFILKYTLFVNVFPLLVERQGFGLFNLPGLNGLSASAVTYPYLRPLWTESPGDKRRGYIGKQGG